MKAILLIRVSTYSQDLLQQRNEVIKEALKDGYKEENLIIIEDKESASKLSEEERNGLNTLKEYIYNDVKKEINCVYIYELSRLSRKTQIIYNIRQFLLDRKIQLICLKPYVKILNEDGTTTQSSDIIFAIYVANAESETMIRMERITRGKKKLQQENKHWTGRPKFGYKVGKDKTYLIDENNSEIVKTIFRLYINKNLSILKIAETLQDRGYFNNKNIYDINRRIHLILQDENYTGNEIYPQIISKEDFNKTKEIRQNKTSYVRKNIYLLTGLIKDKNTNYNFIAYKTSNRYCSKNYKLENNKVIKCKMMTIDIDWIENIIKEYTIDLHKKYKNKKYTSKEILEIQHDINTAKISINNLKDLLNNYQTKIDKIEERLILGKISDSKAEELENNIQTEIEKTKSKLNTYKAKLIYLNELLDKKDNKSKTDLNYDILEKKELKNLIQSVINVIYIEKPKNNIIRLEIYNKYNTKVEIREYKTIPKTKEKIRIL